MVADTGLAGRAGRVVKLSDRQAELLERVCLKAYEVRFLHYMGTWRENESVQVYRRDEHGVDTSFRPTTAKALQDRGLVVFKRTGHAESEIRPTREGLDLFIAQREAAKR